MDGNEGEGLKTGDVGAGGGCYGERRKMGGAGGLEGEQEYGVPEIRKNYCSYHWVLDYPERLFDGFDFFVRI